MLTVVGENAFQTMDSQMLVAMSRLIPEPRPYPFWRSSSRRITIRAGSTTYTLTFRIRTVLASDNGPRWVGFLSDMR